MVSHPIAPQSAEINRSTPIGRLLWLLVRIGSWTDARWDQHLRDEFGDMDADETIEVFSKLLRFNVTEEQIWARLFDKTGMSTKDSFLAASVVRDLLLEAGVHCG